MLELALLPAVILFVFIAVSASLVGLAVGFQRGYNNRLREELETTVADMQHRTDQYRAARNMPLVTPVHRPWKRSRATERVETVISSYFWS
jgi:hypothetical protein